ncbi:MAG: glycosyltransferase [Deltaproteobacteria bacterium]|nr:glycosyltransferase [Deltaproteobacteria bacterium]
MRVTVVIPCFNEEKRLRLDGFGPLLAPRGPGSLLFIDNGSTDGTSRVIAEHRARQPMVELVTLPPVGGKAEAVRQGMLRALAAGAEVVGYLDADLATPAEEMIRVLEPVTSGAAEASIAQRDRAAGDIGRTALRNLLGAGFRALARRVLAADIADTQCGAKAFRAGPPLTRALAEPFHARWAFDVELLGRLFASGLPRARLAQVPLRTWNDVPGSKLGPLDVPRMALELVRIRAALARWR